MASSAVEICNIALGHLGVDPILSFTDGTTPSRTCGTFYDQARQKVLTDSEWSFAILRRELAKSATPPDFGYSTKFKLPSDCLTVIEAFDKSTIGISPATTPNTTEWQVESGYVMCDAEILKIRYIADVPDAALFSAGFTQTLAAYLAYQMAGKLTGTRGLKTDMWQLYKQELEGAKTSDGIQGRTKSVRSSVLVSARNR